VEPAAPEPATAENVDRETLAAEIRSVYATALEYPEEVFADDVLLEAELGVDSVKRVELMDRVAKQHGISSATEGLRLSDYDTIGKIVDFVHDALTEQHGGRPVAAAR
jgi:acyl carrier protein